MGVRGEKDPGSLGFARDDGSYVAAGPRGYAGRRVPPLEDAPAGSRDLGIRDLSPGGTGRNRKEIRGSVDSARDDTKGAQAEFTLSTRRARDDRSYVADDVREILFRTLTRASFFTSRYAKRRGLSLSGRGYLHTDG